VSGVVTEFGGVGITLPPKLMYKVPVGWVPAGAVPLGWQKQQVDTATKAHTENMRLLGLMMVPLSKLQFRVYGRFASPVRLRPKGLAPERSLCGSCRT
jgi:hypothetical protein